jgi:hypothetical protein
MGGKGSDVIGTKLRFRKGDIIFGRRRAYQRKLAVAEVDGICSAHAMVVRAKPAVVLPEFLPFLMMSDRFMKRAVEIGKLLWHALGAKTVELINQNVHLESVRDDVETLVLDAQVSDEILKDADPGKRAREIEIKLIARLKRHLGNPKFTELGERLEKIKERHEQGSSTAWSFRLCRLEDRVP